MKLRSITLDNVRRFTEPVRLGPIGDGVTLLCEPNEAGKSTLFDALYALFFLKHRNGSKEVKALRPHSGGRVAVECEVEKDGALWRIRKEWLASPSAKVWRDGVLTHQGDLAEDWITDLVGGDAGGPGGLLWVRQGRVSLQPPAAKKEAEAEIQERRDLLTVISGAMEQVTGGERMDRIRDAVARELGQVQSATGRPKAHGRWAVAEAEVEALAAQEQELEGQVTDLRQSLDDRRRLRTELDRLQEPQAKAQRAADVAAAEAEMRSAERLASEVAALETQAKLARLQVQETEKEAARASDLWAEVEAAKQALTAAERDQTARDARAKETAQLYTEARSALEAATAQRTTAERILKLLDQREAAERTHRDREALAEQIKRAEAANTERIAQRALAAKGPDAKTVASIEALAAEVTAQNAARAAAAPRVSVQYAEGAELVRLDGKTLAEGESRALPPDGIVEMPAIGQLQITTADAAQGDAVAAAAHALEAALARGDWANIEALHQAAEHRAQAERAADLAQRTLDTLAPEGLDALRLRLAGLGEDTGAEEPSSPPSPPPSLPPRAEAEEALARATQELQNATAQAAQADDQNRSATLAAATATAVAEAAKTRLASATAPLDGTERPDAQAVKARLDPLRASAEAADAAYAERAAQSPDMDQLRARLNRLRAVAETSVARIGEIGAEIGRLDGRIETRGEEGVEEALEDTRGKLAAARETLARVVFDRDVSVRLLAALDDAQKAARDTYFGPIAAELRPLLADLWEDAEVQWSDTTLLPDTLVRKGTQEAIDVLSGGTQEQIALLVRLAFARLLAKSGRHAPLILDDALVYSDDDRIERMFDALHAAAPELQIIVLSCRQRAFRDLGAPSVSFEPVDGP